MTVFTYEIAVLPCACLLPLSYHLCTSSHNMQVEADNLDCVTKSALLAQENQHLKERLETQTQQMLHMEHEVCEIDCLRCGKLALWLTCSA